MFRDASSLNYPSLNSKRNHRMNAFLSLGRWLFAIPFAILGLINFLSTKTMVESFVPTYLPAPAIWVFLGGAGLVAASISILIGKYDKLACTLLAIYLLLMVFLVHLQAAMAGSISAQFLLFKDLALAGAAMMYAQQLSKDRSVIG
jgi:uncharacterized membrane protein YphA (DoxX/SURF4 family)